MKYSFILLSLLITGLISCKKESKSYHDNGSVHEVFNTDSEGKKHGVFQRYDENGNLFEDAHYTNGQLDGQRSIYYPTGEVEIIEIYSQGKLDGPYKRFAKNGQLILDATYTDNIMGGIVKGYYENGTLKEEVTFENNEENGSFTEYHENGNISWKGTYINGDNEFGVLEEYDINGQLIKKLYCNEKGICKTIWTLEGGDIKDDEKDA